MGSCASVEISLCPERVELPLDDVPAWRCATVVSREEGKAMLCIDASDDTEQVQVTQIAVWAGLNSEKVGSECSARLLSAVWPCDHFAHWPSTHI